MVDSTRQVGVPPHHTDDGCHPGIPPTVTPNPDGSALLPVSLPRARSSNCCHSTKAHQHTVQERTALLECPLWLLLWHHSLSHMALLLIARTKCTPQLFCSSVVSLFRCQLCCVTTLFLRICTHVCSPKIESSRETKVQMPPKSNVVNKRFLSWLLIGAEM